MSDPFVGEVRLFAGNFPPLGWSLCDGQRVSIAENPVLFDLIGTLYGGDGVNTYALPDLRGRVPVHQGGGYAIGQPGGVETVTLDAAQMPPHTHAMLASTTPASATHGAADVLGSSASMKFYGTGAPDMPMDPNALAQAGGNQPHENMPPFTALNYIISMFGIFPSQS